MSRHRWLLPETPDVVGLLRAHVAVTIEGIDALTSWAGGDTSSAELVREAEDRGNAAKRELLGALRVALVTPLEPEDVFALSRSVGWILDYAHDLVSESQAMSCPPDGVIAEMSRQLGQSLRQVDRALAHLGTDDDAASEAADEAIRLERELERVYYRGMAALLEVEDRSQRIARRELYRHCLRVGDLVIDVGERIVYAVIKQS
jgi:uncharacterized protein Yka (UPF0111/DUF47 family)